MRCQAHLETGEPFRPLSLPISDDHPFLGKEMAEPRRFSEHTAQVIDEEVMRILREAAEKATTLIADNRAKLDTLAKKLEEAEVLDEEDIEKLLGPPKNKGVGSLCS
jgi:cell division protease FtsH